MLTDARQRLAEAQTELVRALVCHADAPVEFDPSRIRVTADTLLMKRARAVAHAWPRLARALGPMFDDRFAAYARLTAAPASGPLVDGRAFARTLDGCGELTDEARCETLAFDARYKLCGERIMARRRFGFGATRLKSSARLVIIIRLPLVGERWLNLSLKILLKHRAPSRV
jgi:hypothetical protein